MKPPSRLFLFLALAAAAFAQTPLTLNLSSTATLNSTTTFALTGTGSITGLGSAALVGGGTLDGGVGSGQAVVLIPGYFTLSFSDGATLYGTFSIPAAIVVPQLGGTATGAGAITVSGGTGRFEGTRGVFTGLSGSGTATGLTSATSNVSGTGLMGAGESVLPQFVFGDGWYTALYFSNATASPVVFPVNFIADNGTPLNVPSLGGSSTTVNIPAGGSARLEAPNAGALVQGYASVTLPVGVTGYAVFRQTLPNTPDQEAVVPLTSARSTSASLTFDDTNFITAAGIVNPSAQAVTVTITARSANGGLLGTATLPLPAKNKTAVALRNVNGLSAVANNRGTVTFTVPTGNIAVLGLRFFGAAFTSIPATER